MRVLVACECSGRVRDAFLARGHDAWSCDLKPSEVPGPHIQDDALTVLGDGWDLMIAHPECKYLARSGLHWIGRIPGREAQSREALAFVRRLMDAPILRIAIENPPGMIGTNIRPADQYINPYEFGHDARKPTGLWLKNLPRLTGTSFTPGRLVGGLYRWANQTDSGQDRTAPGPERSADRARTYQGIADAMAEQWGVLDAYPVQMSIFERV